MTPQQLPLPIPLRSYRIDPVMEDAIGEEAFAAGKATA